MSNQLKEIIETAAEELFIIDPDLGADFVWDYLVHTRQGVSVRLLTSKHHLDTLLPAVAYWIERHQAPLQVRSATDIHDRYVIVDKNSCYQPSPPSKDNAKKTPTTMTEITDAFTVVQETYEQLWDKAQVELPHPGM